jgi:hypothetical protein
MDTIDHAPRIFIRAPARSRPFPDLNPTLILMKCHILKAWARIAQSTNLHVCIFLYRKIWPPQITPKCYACVTSPMKHHKVFLVIFSSKSKRVTCVCLGDVE